MSDMLSRVYYLDKRISLSILGKQFHTRIDADKKHFKRVFIQMFYLSVCTKTGEEMFWYGRKWYLSEHMTDDEIIKTIYAAFEAAVKHEIMEGFKVDGIVLFNPHVDFEELLKISHKEVNRVPKQT